VSQHPELDEIKNYLNNTAAVEFSGLRLHLAQCAECRNLADSVQSLQSISQLQINDSLSEHQHQQITDYVDGALDESAAQKIKTLLEQSPAAMKAALHYASHKSASQKVLIEPTDAAEGKSANLNKFKYAANVFNQIKTLLSFQTPVWLSVPVAAALLAVLSVNLYNDTDAEKINFTLASYQDNPVIQFSSKDAIPGIGFFSRTDQLTKTYDGLQVSVSDDGRFTLRWPPVADAATYTLRLEMFENGNKVELANITTQETFAVITLELASIFHRYEWKLSGETNDQRDFIAKGGFVINETTKGK